MSLLDLTREYGLMTFTGKMASFEIIGEYFFIFFKCELGVEIPKQLLF